MQKNHWLTLTHAALCSNIICPNVIIPFNFAGHNSNILCDKTMNCEFSVTKQINRMKMDDDGEQEKQQKPESQRNSSRTLHSLLHFASRTTTIIRVHVSFSICGRCRHETTVKVKLELNIPKDIESCCNSSVVCFLVVARVNVKTVMCTMHTEIWVGQCRNSCQILCATRISILMNRKSRWPVIDRSMYRSTKIMPSPFPISLRWWRFDARRSTLRLWWPT